MPDGGEGPTLLQRVEAYLAANRMAPSRFGQIAVRSPSLVQRMREGKNVGRKTKAAIEAVLLQQQQPQNVAQWKFGKYRTAMEEARRLEEAENLRRRTDPVERAATFLRRTVPMVCRESVFGDREGWRVGTATLTDEGLIERARRMGWEE